MIFIVDLPNEGQKMNIDKFIHNFAEQFDLDGKAGDLINASTEFRTLEEWSSMHALLVIAMIDAEYDVVVTGDELMDCKTVEDVYGLVHSKVGNSSKCQHKG